MIEFLFATPAIAFALGSYLHFIVPGIPVALAAIAVFFVFTIINLFGVHQTARFELVVTLIAVVELLVFLAIEGVAMAAEEVENPARDIPKGYISGILTLVVLAVAVMFGAGGVGDWKRLSHMDYPIPEAMAMALGAAHPVVKILAGIGLFGLVASLNGIVYRCSRQVYGLSRAGLLPSVFARISKAQVPYMSVLLSFVVGVISILSGKTSELITLSALDAVLMYILSMLSLFVLRRKMPNLQRPFRVPFYPYFPGVALVLSAVNFFAMVYYNPKIAAVLVAIFVVLAFAHAFFRKDSPR